MITKLILGVAITSTLVSAIDYGKAAESVKVPEAITTVSKGTDMTMDDVSNSVDAEKLTAAVIESEDATKATAEVTETKKEVAEVKQEVANVEKEVAEVEKSTTEEKTEEKSSGLLNSISSWF